MSSAREILKGFREKRDADAAAESLRIPVPHPLVLLGTLLLWAALQCGPMMWVMLSVGRDRSTYYFVGGWSLFIAASTAWGLAAALRKRDRLWRELVRKEAPELYAKIQKTEG